jgi:hypothetical protein
VDIHWLLTGETRPAKAQSVSIPVKIPPKIAFLISKLEREHMALLESILEAMVKRHKKTKKREE